MEEIQEVDKNIKVEATQLDGIIDTKKKVFMNKVEML